MNHNTFLASSADTPPFSSMTDAMDLATPTAELPAPKNTMRASFSSVPCAFMPLMNLHETLALVKLKLFRPAAAAQKGVTLTEVDHGTRS